MNSTNVKNRWEFENFFKSLRPLLVAFAYRITGIEDDAEDAVQDALIDIYLELERKEKSENSLSDEWVLPAYALTIKALSNSLGAKPPWKKHDHNLVYPILTEPPFWERLAKETRGAIAQKESFHLGFMTLLQWLPFRARVIAVGQQVLGWSAETLAALLEITQDEVERLGREGQALLRENFFNRGDQKILWRASEGGEKELSAERLQDFLKVLNRGERESFKRAIDPSFRCLLRPAPFIHEEIFFNDFLARVPICRLTEIELNGVPAIVFEDDKEIQALAQCYFSAKGAATVLGYDVSLLSPKILGFL